VIEVDVTDPNDGYMRTRRPHRFVSTGRDALTFNRGTAGARRLAVDKMIQALAAKTELDRQREQEARLMADKRRVEVARRRIRSLQRQVARGQPLEPSQQAVLGYYTALKDNMDGDNVMAKGVLDMLMRMNVGETKFKNSLDSIIRTRGFDQWTQNISSSNSASLRCSREPARVSTDVINITLRGEIEKFCILTIKSTGSDAIYSPLFNMFIAEFNALAPLFC